MKKKRNLASFFAGVMTVLLTFGCLTSAMAASGEVTSDFFSEDLMEASETLDTADLFN